MDLRSYCRLLMRRWPVLLTVFLVVGAALAGAGFLIPSTYTANARIVFAPKLSGFVSMGTRQEAQTYVADRMKTYAQLVTTNRVLQPVIDSLNLGVTVPDLVKKNRSHYPDRNAGNQRGGVGADGCEGRRHRQPHRPSDVTGCSGPRRRPPFDC